MNAILTTCVGLFVSSLAAHALTFSYHADLSGPAEAPPNASPGTGSAFVTYDDVAHTLRIQATFSGLIGTTTAAHIHGPTALPFTSTAGVMTQTPSFTGFPLGVTAGTFDNTFDLTLASSYNASFLNNAINLGNVSTAEASLIQAIVDGKAYFNIHSTEFGGGEIRGFFSRVPDAGATAGLLVLGFGTLYGCRRFSQR
jgi:hypothetical protein